MREGKVIESDPHLLTPRFIAVSGAVAQAETVFNSFRLGRKTVKTV